MKNLKVVMLTLITAIFFVSTANAQLVPLYKTSGTLGNVDSIASATAANEVDTLTNAGTQYIISRTSALNAFTSGRYAITFTARSYSGTPATTKAIIEGSYDGQNWFKLTGVPGTDGYNCDTLSFTPSTTATQYTMFSNPGGAKYIAAYAAVPFSNTRGRVLYVRLYFIGSGTQATRIHGCRVYTFQ